MPPLRLALARLTLASVALLGPTLSPVHAQDAAPATDLVAWGKLKQVGKSEFLQLSYRVYDRVDQRYLAKKAFVQTSEEMRLLWDRPLPLTAFSVEEEVWVFANPVETEMKDDLGRVTHVDRQMKNTQVVCRGEELRLNPEAATPAPASQRWLKVIVTQAGRVLHVEHNEEEYRLVLLKNAAVFERVETSKRPKLKKIRLGAVIGAEAEARPPKDDPELASYRVRTLILLDKRWQGVLYPYCFPQPKKKP